MISPIVWRASTQAATPRTANALPPVTNAPLAMHQSGWTDEIVNRVMYLSSANLKSAEIQLQPAELGRLDIKVNMTADQQAQVNFMSAHPVVREALESQSGRLREMFAQQGMGRWTSTCPTNPVVRSSNSSRPRPVA